MALISRPAGQTLGSGRSSLERRVVTGPKALGGAKFILGTLLLQTVAVIDENKTKLKKLCSWFASRTALEYSLGILCLMLVVGLIAALRALAEESAPLEAAWGSYADWLGAIVTLGGFLGAIATLYFQGRGLRMQEDAHNRDKDQREQGEEQRRTEENRRKQEERERVAHAVKVMATATHRQRLIGHHSDRDGRLRVSVTVTPPKGQPVFDARLNVPEEEWLTVEKDRVEEELLDGAKGKNLCWEAWAGSDLMGGDDDKAQQWIEESVSVDFTDQKGIRWRKDAGGKIRALSDG